MRDIYLQLESVTQRSIGRPFPKTTEDGVPIVGPAVFDYDSTGSLIGYGPFSTLKEWFEKCMDQRKKLITTGEVATTAPDDALLVNRYLLDAVPDIVNPLYNSGPFYLLHPDSRDCNYLVDDNFTITCVIDWETALFVPKDSAFKAPLFMVVVGAFYSGNIEASVDEEMFAKEFDDIGRWDLAEIVRRGGGLRAFEMSISIDPFDREDFEVLFAGARRFVDGNGPSSWEEWKAQYQNKTSIL
jgi:hypothetical protein